MRKPIVHFMAACGLLLSAQTVRADTLVFDNFQPTGYVFQLPANTEVLDYATSDGGWVSRFAFSYSAGASGTVRVRFYYGTDPTAPGSPISEYVAAVTAAVSPQICEVVIPEAARVELPPGAFGYSFETTLSSLRVEMATGGDGVDASYWRKVGGRFWLFTNDQPQNFSLRLHTQLPLDQVTCDITGIVFNDLDGDGAQGPADPAGGGRVVFLDANNDGLHQPTEPNVTAGSDGTFMFENLPAPAAYRVRQVVPEGWRQTVPGSEDDFCYTVSAEPNNVYGPLWFGSIALPVKYGGGSGTPENPYQVRTPAHMNAIGLNPDDWNACFILINDLDMTGMEHHVIGYHASAADRKYFTGTFNGNQHVIRNLACHRTSTANYTGLFGYAQNAQIFDLGLLDVNISSAGGCIGGLVGYQIDGSIERCFVTGQVCSLSTAYYLGGLAGFLNGAVVTDCRSDVDVHAMVPGGSFAGGFAGAATSLVNCYSRGPVIGSVSMAGGLTGSGGTFVSCYWDIDTSGRSTGGGIPKTTDQMRLMSTYTGWDFAAAWRICDGMNYPRLRWEPVAVGDFVCPEGVEQADLLFMADQWQITGPSIADVAPAGRPDAVVNLQDMAALSAQWLMSTD